MKNESQSTQQNVMFKSYYPGLADLPRSLAASVREALGLSPASRHEAVSAIGPLLSMMAPVHRSPPKVVHEDAKRIIVELNHLSHPLTLEAAGAVSALPYLRVWVEAPTMQDLVMPSPNEAPEESQSALLAMAPLFDPAFEPGLSTHDSRKVILRIMANNVIDTPEWFWALMKRNVTLKFQQARVDGLTELNIVEELLPPGMAPQGIALTVGVADGDIFVQKMPALPPDIDELLFPFLAGQSMCTNSEWEAAGLLKLICATWVEKVRGYTCSIGSTHVLIENNLATADDRCSMVFMENLGTALCMLHKHFAVEDYLNYPIGFLKFAQQICTIVSQRCPMLSSKTAEELEQTFRYVVAYKTLSAHAVPNVVEVTATKRRI